MNAWDHGSQKSVGRPPAGAREGERKATLHALSLVASRPQWRIVCDALECYLAGRSETERKKVKELARRRIRRR